MKNKIIKTLVFLMCYNINTTWAADKLGRLFTLPYERAQLDKWRVVMPPKPPELPVPSQDSKTNVGKLDTPNFITFNGIILRQGKPPIIWLNGSTNKDLQGFGIDEKAIQNMALPVFLQEWTTGENPQITWSKEAIFLKPAQILDTRHRKIVEKYAEESIAQAETPDVEMPLSTVSDNAESQTTEKQPDSSF